MDDGDTFGISPESVLQMILATGMAIEALLEVMAGDMPAEQNWTYEQGRATPQDND